MDSQVEFWRLPTVMQKTGLSKSDIYRRISYGKFPKSRPYPDSDATFWLNKDVIAWQLEALGVDEVCNG